MNTIKKVLLFLFGILLLIFGNRDVLAKINKTKTNPADNKEKQIASGSAEAAAQSDTAKQNVAPVTKNNQTAHQPKELANNSNTGEHKQKPRKVVKSEENEKAVKSTPATTIEKDKPEKASSTE